MSTKRVHTCVAASQTFSCPNFDICFYFGGKGKLSGKITHFSKEAKLINKFDGLYTIDNNTVNLAFIVQLNNPNLDFGITTAFSGKIVYCGSNLALLVLSWLMDYQSIMPEISFIESHEELLHNQKSEIERHRMRRVKKHKKNLKANFARSSQ